MLQVVADKTGYPKEIIDLDTDLESGLGIDSIKRVEILSALQEKFPVLKNADKARLAAMKTLGEILAFAGERHFGQRRKCH
jgi:acyl carrier protein